MKRGWWLHNKDEGVSAVEFLVDRLPIMLTGALSGAVLQRQVGGTWRDCVRGGTPVVLGSGGDTLLLVAMPGRYRLNPEQLSDGDLVWAEPCSAETLEWLDIVRPGRDAQVADALDRLQSQVHRHGASLADIDDAAAKRHEHQASLADIDDAAAKRHQHGASLSAIDRAAAWAHQHADLAALEAAVPMAHQHQAPLADIDDAAAKRHEHGASLADIDDAAAKRHEHGASLADIDDAVAKRHEHGVPLVDIDDAAVKRHEHANKALLDSIGTYDWGGNDTARRIGTPVINGVPLVRINEGNISVTVAPDAASRESGDWEEVGWKGVLSAFRALHSTIQTKGNVAEIVLRDGVYVVADNSEILGTASTGGARIRIRAMNAPSLPDLSSWSFYNGGTPDRAADVAALEAAYPVRIEFPSWALLWAYEDAVVYFKDLLFKATNRGTAIRTRGSTYVYASRCSAIDCGYAINADFGSFVRWDGGVVFPAEQAVIANAASGSQVLFNPYGSQPFVGGHCRIGFYGTTGGLMQVWGGTSVYHAIGAVSASVGYAYASGMVQFVRTDLYRCATNTAYDVFYATEGSRVLAHSVRFHGNGGRAINVVRGSFGYLYNCVLDSGGSDRARTLRAAANGTVWSYGLTGGTPVYDPAKGTSTSTGGVNV